MFQALFSKYFAQFALLLISEFSNMTVSRFEDEKWHFSASTKGVLFVSIGLRATNNFDDFIYFIQRGKKLATLYNRVNFI